jgi:dUTP pyrophosphatase
VTLNINIKRLSPLAVVPEYASAGAAGLDLVATEEHRIEVGKTSIVGTGIALELPAGYAALVLPRSGLAAKSAITVINAPGLIDSDYRGEIKVILTKLNKDGDLGHHRIDPGERIAQLVILPYPVISFTEVEELGDTDRGEGGFGSTGTATS